MQKESRFALKVDERIKRLAKKHEQHFKSFNIQQQSICGTPDRLICVNGLFVALELKKDGVSKRSELQRYEISKIVKSGGYGRFIYPENFELVMEEIESLFIRRRLL